MVLKHCHDQERSWHLFAGGCCEESDTPMCAQVKTKLSMPLWRVQSPSGQSSLPSRRACQGHSEAWLCLNCLHELLEMMCFCVSTLAKEKETLLFLLPSHLKSPKLVQVSSHKGRPWHHSQPSHCKRQWSPLHVLLQIQVLFKGCLLGSSLRSCPVPWPLWAFLEVLEHA